jgi:uncharacterized membrane protein
MMTALPPSLFRIILSITHISLNASLPRALHPKGKLANSSVQHFRFNGIEPVNAMVDEDVQFSWTVVLACSSATLNDDA